MYLHTFAFVLIVNLHRNKIEHDLTLIYQPGKPGLNTPLFLKTHILLLALSSGIPCPQQGNWQLHVFQISHSKSSSGIIFRAM